MVNLQTLEKQREITKAYSEHIIKVALENKDRYIVIRPDCYFTKDKGIEFYKDKESLFEQYPSFKKGAPITFGTPPLLIDVWKETNLTEYEIEQTEKNIQTRQEWIKDYKTIIKKEKGTLKQLKRELKKSRKRSELEKKFRN